MIFNEKLDYKENGGIFKCKNFFFKTADQTRVNILRPGLRHSVILSKASHFIYIPQSKAQTKFILVKFCSRISVLTKTIFNTF